MALALALAAAMLPGCGAGPAPAAAEADALATVGADLAEFRRAFDAGAARPRFVALVAPT